MIVCRHRSLADTAPADDTVRPGISPGASSAAAAAEGRPHASSVEARWASQQSRCEQLLC